MPTHIKIIVSILAVALCTIFFFVATDSGAARWIALALGPFMVFGIWVFPEPKADDVRKHAARQRDPSRKLT